MKKNKNLKYYFFILLFSLIIFLTFKAIFLHNDINDIMTDLSNINLYYIFICVILLCLYFLLQGIYMKRNLKLLKQDIKLHKGIFYSIVEFFFSGITPSSTGGQPLQLYYMDKDKISKKKSLVTLIINTMFFKLIIVILGLGIFIFKHKLIMDRSPLFIFFYFLGILADLIMVIISYLLLFHQNLLTKILTIIEKIIKKFFKNYDMKIDEFVTTYNSEVKNLKDKKLELFFEFIITFIQRLCMFSISYIVYRSFGLNRYSYFQVIIIQISVQTAIEFIPLPGGTGVSEYLFKVFFITIFSEDLSSTAMLVTRTFTFYIPLLVCGLSILFVFIKDIVKKEIIKKKS